MKFLKKISLTVLIAGLLIGLYVGGNIIYGTLTDFKPPPEMNVQVDHRVSASIQDSAFSFITWNVGYGGLGSEMDFFYDGGKTVRTPEAWVKKYLSGIDSFLMANHEVDFILFQEIDSCSARTHYVDEYKEFSNVLDNHNAAFGINYKVDFVPVPIYCPMGSVLAGLGTFSKYTPDDVKRYSYPSHFSWPTSIYFLDRCFMPERFHLQNGKDFIVINTHNSAYDYSGDLKKQELTLLQQYATAEYSKGNYVVVGGDWNEGPPGFQYSEFHYEVATNDTTPPMSNEYFKGWRWVFDLSAPTNRSLLTPYVHGKNFVTTIDYFLCSPNVVVDSVKVMDMDFRYSDHNPVYMKATLK